MSNSFPINPFLNVQTFKVPFFTFLKCLLKIIEATMRFLLLFGFLHLIDAQGDPDSQSYPGSFVPENLGEINKVIDVTFTHNLPNNFDLREEDDYTWSYFTTGLGFQLNIRHI